MKKTAADLEQIRKETLKNVELRTGKDGYKIIVGMATCGIAAGAREVFKEAIEKVIEKDLDSVTVGQMGCIGLCSMEPIVEVVSPSGEKTRYIKVNKEKIDNIITSHIIDGNVVSEYTSES